MPLSAASAPGVHPPTLFPGALGQKLETEGIAAVITVERAEDAVPLARSLVSGGIRVIELAWRTPATLAAVKAIKQEVPEMVLGVGTLLSAEQVRLARDAGADFGVSPGLSVAVVEAARACQLPFAPGIQTASEVQMAVEHGCRWLKFFPAESAGGLTHLRNLQGPFAHLGLRYIALGGINEANAEAYMAEPAVAVVGGSWIAPTSLVKDRAWDTVRQRAQAARILVERKRREIAA